MLLVNRFTTVEDAVAHAHSMANEGADFIDIGAQSTRPNATRLSTEEELSRLVPVLEAFRADPTLKDVKLSVDTFDARCAKYVTFISSLALAFLKYLMIRCVGGLLQGGS